MRPEDANPRVELEERLRFETLIADLSSKFVNLPSSEVDHNIEDAQRRVCECLRIDLCALWQWTPDAPRYITITHLYRPLGGPPPPERVDGEEMAPWCLRQLAAGKIVAVPSMESLPPEAARDRDVWRHYGVKSALNFPLSAGGQIDKLRRQIGDERLEAQALLKFRTRVYGWRRHRLIPIALGA